MNGMRFKMRRFSPRGACVSIVFLTLISSDPLRAQTPDQGDTPAGAGITDTSAACNPLPGDDPADSAGTGQSPSMQNNTSRSHDHDWVHAWFNMVDETREN